MAMDGEITPQEAVEWIAKWGEQHRRWLAVRRRLWHVFTVAGIVVAVLLMAMSDATDDPTGMHERVSSTMLVR